MLLFAWVKEEKRVKIPPEIKGFERLRFSSSQIPAVTLLIIQPEFRQSIEKKILCFTE
jgi:hypothetical protein